MAAEKSQVTKYFIQRIQAWMDSEMAEEGLRLHHCVFANKYYAKKDTLILSARTKGGGRLETVEVDTKRWEVVQSRGLLNNPSERHAEIVELVEENMYQLKKCV